MGSSCAAFLAGYHPKKTPVKVQTAKLIMIVHGSMDIGQWANALIAYEAPIPRITPIIPPVTLSIIASIRNWLRISTPLAPTLILRPISLVRSVTLTYMMFIMPIPPTISEIPATHPR